MKIKKLFATIFVLVITMTTMLMTSCSSGLKIPDEYNYDDLSKYIQLGNYKGIEYEKVDPKVTEDDIQDYINDKLSENKTSKKVEEGTVAEDSVVNIDYVGYIDGKKFDGGSAEGTDLDIANSNFIPGFAEGIVGHAVGETFDLNVTFPSDYASKEFAGKDAVFKTTINYISEAVLPEYNDKFVQSISEYSTTEEYEKSINDLLVKDKQAEASSDELSSVFDKILEGSKVLKYPEKELNSRLDTIIATYGDDSDDFKKQATEMAQETVKAELVLRQIANVEKIEISDASYNEFIDKLLSDAGITKKDFEKNAGMTIADYAEKNSLFNSYLYQSVLDKVMEYSVAK